MLIRTDPGKRRLAFLSIPRDLQVEIPEVGVAKINAANQIGGPALALRTVERLTGLDVNHVAFVDFDRFRELIDAVGGIDVVVARPIRSNRFDCPYGPPGGARSGPVGGSSAESSTWTGTERSCTRASDGTCSTRARPTSRAHAGSSRSFRRPSTRSRASAPQSACPSSARTSSHRSRPTSAPGS